MYYNSLNQLDKSYDKLPENLSFELKRGLRSLNAWIVSLPPRYRQNLNPIVFSNSEQVPLDVTLRIFNDAAKINMFSARYAYRSSMIDGGIVTARNYSTIITFLNEIGRMNQQFAYSPDLIEKTYRLIESTNDEYQDSREMLKQSASNGLSTSPLTKEFIKKNIPKSDIYDIYEEGSEEF